MLRIGVLSAVAALMLGACATDGETVATRSTVCDTEITGSHFKRCTRDGSVESVSREDLDRAAPNRSTMTRDPPRGGGR